MITVESTHEQRQYWSIAQSIDSMTDKQLVDLVDQFSLTATALRRLVEVRQMTYPPSLPGQSAVDGHLRTLSFSTVAAPVTLLEVAISSLSEIGWRGADLAGANLNGAVLVGAKLVGALFWDADLRTANLANADLRWASFWHTDLRGANLTGANLEWAGMWGAYLQGACYSEKTVWPAGFAPDRYGAIERHSTAAPRGA